jgi:hypothetical protein
MSVNHEFDESIKKPHESWVLRDNGLGGKYWDSPVALPVDGKTYYWHEESLSWKEVE